MHLLDIIGPIMIGPSSSHTAGAARIGRIARGLLGQAPRYADIGFHGSFAKTYQGHGTDRAVVGGLLDMDVDDPRLRDSLTLAKEAGLAYTFHEVSLRDVHPNTLELDVTGKEGARLRLRAASVGGGSIRVTEIDGLPVRLTGESHTLVLLHRDTPGVIARISGLLARESLNIATMNVGRQSAGRNAITVLELDALPGSQTVQALNGQPDIDRVTLLTKAERGVPVCS